MDNYYKSNPRGSWRGRRPSRGRGFPHGSRGRFQSQNVPRCWFCGQLGHCYYNCPLNSLSLSSSHLNFRHESQAFQFPVLSTTTKMSITPTYFDKLNDDCVRLIFAEFSLQEHLLLLRAVCRRWKTLVGQICASKRSLTLFGAFADIFVLINTLSINTPCLQFSATYRENAFAIKAVGSDNDLVLSINDDLDYQNVWQFIVQQFPSVQKLVICLHGDQYNHLAKLLLLYPDLKEVVLFGSESANMSELFQQICRLKSLTVFEYYLSKNRSSTSSTNELINLNPNLERLSLGTIRNVVGIMRNMNPDTLTKLTLYEMDLNQFSLLLKECPAFSKNLKELSVYFVNRQLLDFICKHFRAISKLHIGHDLWHVPPELTPSIYDIAESLSSMPDLVVLGLESFFLIEWDMKNTDEARQLVPVTSIKEIYMGQQILTTSESLTKFCRMLETVFPNVEQIHLECYKPETEQFKAIGSPFIDRFRFYQKDFLDFEGHRRKQINSRQINHCRRPRQHNSVVPR